MYLNPPKRFVPAIVGLIALLASVGVILGFEGWWRYLLAVPLLAFGWVSAKTAFLASDSEIRELTGEAPMSKNTERRFIDRL
jgi:hypothetical protein